jgi:sterol desaturase/sphingolipid hydroxylase (fatty acid hydroxylase superfamily)
MEAIVDAVSTVVSYVLDRLNSLFLGPGSEISLTSLGCALAVALVFLAVRHYRRRRRMRLKVLLRALFPRRITRHPSTLLDLGYLFVNVFLFGAIFGWALLSYQWVSNGVTGLLTTHLGAVSPSALPGFIVGAIVTVCLFLAYELGYWVHHYLCHRVPFLWEFHKVHHSANVLTPLTVFRVHPVDTWLFANLLVLFVGTANGLANYAFGITTYQYALSNTNIILVVFVHAYIHLQHSHLWITFRGWAGRIFMSPAHHQVHHSNNPVHFNKNLGSCLSLWDWLFGTLYVPAKHSENLRFGVAPDGRDEQTITALYITPVVDAARHVTALAGGRGESAAERAAPAASEPALRI